MSKENKVPPPGDDDPPLDDYGIELDRMLEVCEKMIQRLHERYVGDDVKPKDAAEIKDIVSSLESILNVTRSILNIDDVINSAMHAISKGQPPVLFEEEDEDEDGDEDEDKLNEDEE